VSALCHTCVGMSRLLDMLDSGERHHTAIALTGRADCFTYIYS